MVKSAVFKNADHLMLLEMPVKQKKIYYLTKWIEELKNEIELLIKDGFSSHGDLVMCYQNQLVNMIKLRGSLL